MSTTVIILNFNGEKYIKKLLDTLEETKVPVLVVDNASKDDSKKIFDKHFKKNDLMDWIQLKKNVGFARGNNIGAEYAGTENILFLNNDTEPKSDFVSKMEQCLTTNTPIVGALLTFGEQRDQLITVNGEETIFHTSKGKVQHAGIYYTKGDEPEPYEYGRELGIHELDILKPKVVPSVTGACMLIKKDLFRTLGGFSPEFINGWEDTDLCLRAREAFGSRCFYQPEARIVHYCSKSEGRFDNEDKNKATWKKKWHKNKRILKVLDTNGK